MANFTDRLADVYGDRTLFLLDKPLETRYFSGDVLSYRDVNRLVRRAASMLLRAGVKRGDRVALCTLNRIELAFVEFGAQRIGAIPVPLNFMLTQKELQHLIVQSGAKIIVTDRAVLESNICDRAQFPSIEKWIIVSSKDLPEGVQSFDTLMAEADESVEPVDLKDEDPAIIFFTAGTTGLPKGALLTSGGLMFAFRKYVRLAATLPTSRKRLALMVMPLAHTGGHQALLVHIALSTPSLVVGRFDPERMLDYIEQYRVSWFAGIPTMYRMLIEAGAESRNLSSIDLWGGGGDAFPADLIQKVRKLSPRSVFITGYGMAETAGQVSITPPFIFEGAGDACIGWFLPDVKWRLVDGEGRDVKRGEPGELLIKSPGMMHGYWNDPTATDKTFSDGWLRTGDLLRTGRFGAKYFVSREKEMIKVGGYSVFPAEVEQVLDQHPAIDRSVVVGLPHSTKGELPVAAVQLKESVTEAELLEWCKERIAPYRCPRRFVFVDDIPVSFGMKPQRRLVRERLIAMGIVVTARSDRKSGSSAVVVIS